MKKIIILLISIIIPLLGGVGVGIYARNVRYVPESNTTMASRFRASLNNGIITSEGRIDNYRQFENYYYDEEPVLLEDIKNDFGSDMLTIAVYRSLYYYQPSADQELTERVRYDIFVYNINYNLIKDYFTLDDRTVIDNAPLPTITFTITPSNGEDPFTGTLTNRSEVMVPDYNAVPEWADDNQTTRNYVQSYLLRAAPESAVLKFDKDVEITLNATLSITGSDSTTVTINSDREIAKVSYDDFQTNIKNVDTSNYLKGFREAGVNATYRNAGYYKWLFTHYIWWECLIAVVLVGFITGTFYLVWTAEEKVKSEKKQVRKSRR